MNIPVPVVYACCVTIAFILLWAGIFRRLLARRRAVVKPPVITDPWRAAVLARACGPCTNIPGTRTCICAGSCGHRRCKARPVSTDLATALQRITREGSTHEPR